MLNSIDTLLILARREGAHRLLEWLASTGQGSIRGWLLEAAEQAIEDGELDDPANEG